MFTAKLSKVSLLKQTLEAVRRFANEVNVACGGEGIHLQTIDPAHTVLISLFLRPAGFQNYSCDGDIMFGINLFALFKILRIARGGDSVTLSIATDAKELSVAFGIDRILGQLTQAIHIADEKPTPYSLELIDVEQPRFNIPQIDYEAVIKMPSAELYRICGFSGEAVSIAATMEGVNFSIAGGEMSEVDVVLHPSRAVAMRVAKTVKLSVSQPILIDISKAAVLSNTVILSLHSDFPLVVQYDIKDKLGLLQYYLAPIA